MSRREAQQVVANRGARSPKAWGGAADVLSPGGQLQDHGETVPDGPRREASTQGLRLLPQARQPVAAAGLGDPVRAGAGVGHAQAQSPGTGVRLHTHRAGPRVTGRVDQGLTHHPQRQVLGGGGATGCRWRRSPPGLGVPTPQDRQHAPQVGGGLVPGLLDLGQGLAQALRIPVQTLGHGRVHRDRPQPARDQVVQLTGQRQAVLGHRPRRRQVGQAGLVGAPLTPSQPHGQGEGRHQGRHGGRPYQRTGGLLGAYEGQGRHEGDQHRHGPVPGRHLLSHRVGPAAHAPTLGRPRWQRHQTTV